MAPAWLGDAWLRDSGFPIWRPQGTKPREQKAGEASERSNPGFVMGPDPWFNAKDGTPAGLESTGIVLATVCLAECLLESAGAGTTMPIQAPGGGPAEVQRPSLLRGAFSHQSGISLGRTLVRIGRRWAALLTALLSRTQGTFSPRACCGRPGIAWGRRCPPHTHPWAPAQWSVPRAELKD